METRGELEFFVYAVFIFWVGKTSLAFFSHTYNLQESQSYDWPNFFHSKRFDEGEKHYKEEAGHKKGGKKKHGHHKSAKRQSENPFSLILYIHSFFISATLNILIISLFLPCRSKHHLDADHFKKASSHKKGSHHHEDGGKGLVLTVSLFWVKNIHNCLSFSCRTMMSVSTNMLNFSVELRAEFS